MHEMIDFDEESGASEQGNTDREARRRWANRVTVWVAIARPFQLVYFPATSYLDNIMLTCRSAAILSNSLLGWLCCEDIRRRLCEFIPNRFCAL